MSIYCLSICGDCADNLQQMASDMLVLSTTASVSAVMLLTAPLQAQSQIARSHALAITPRSVEVLTICLSIRILHSLQSITKQSLITCHLDATPRAPTAAR